MNDDPFVARGRDADPSTEFASTDHHAPTAPDVFAIVGLIGSSAPMLRLRADILRYARSAAPVLITGETGSGKELVARALHLASPRAKQPFVAANCATLGQSDLSASELWGHERGAFTGALTRRRGLFEQAHGGTLFLDEIGELDAATQAGLLRALETGEIRPLGAERARTVDVRVLCATHRDLRAMTTAGTFREDLYFRLNVLAVTVPPLRARRSDLPALVAHLLRRLRAEVGDRRLTREALALLAEHPWPGNVRQLLALLRRAALRNDITMLDSDALTGALDADITPRPAVPYRVPARRDLSAATVAEAMSASGGNISRAARSLGVARSTLRGRLPEAP